MALSSLAHPVPAAGEIVLQRENLRQMALVSARLEGRDLGSAVQEIRSKLAKIALPVGYSTEVGGQYESQQRGNAGHLRQPLAGCFPCRKLPQRSYRQHAP